MDVLCDTLLLEEILPRLPPKHLLRLGATSSRYNALARRPGFAARYWRRAGVFLQPAGGEQRKGALPSVPAVPRFLAAPAACQGVAELMPGADLAEDGTAIVHSAAGGLLLCSSNPTPARTARYYVYNPVTRQRVALPELRGLCYQPQCALLTVAGDAGATRFQVVVIEEWQMEDTFLERKIFSSDSDTGRWKSKHLSLHMHPYLPFEPDFGRRPVLGPSGAAYWIQRDDDEAIAYDSATNSLRVIRLPGSHRTGGRSKLCIGERHGGGGLRFALADESALEVWDSETTAGGAWVLAHRVGIADLPGPAASRHRRVKPVGFHPTDVDVVLLALPAGGLAAYSMEHGTMNLLCAHDCFAHRADVFPYVHPPYPVQIPAIKKNPSASALPRKRKARDDEISSKNRTSSSKR